MSSIQYTIRKIPEPVDRVLRKRAKREGKSFNTIVVEALSLETFGKRKVPNKTDFSWFVGAGKDLLGPEFDEAIADQSKVDADLWQ